MHTYPRHRRGGRFFGRRVNCGSVPILPAGAVRQVLDDPRRIPYLFVWKSERDGLLKEAVRISTKIDPPVPFSLDGTQWVEIKRTTGDRNFIRTELRALPRNGGSVRLLVCFSCGQPRRALYGWQPGGRYTNSVQTGSWKCRTCAGLRYASEGGALVLRSRGRWFRAIEMQYGLARSPRPESWYPYVFSSPADAAKVGFCALQF
jgi:hypothetical protein